MLSKVISRLATSAFWASVLFFNSFTVLTTAVSEIVTSACVVAVEVVMVVALVIVAWVVVAGTWKMVEVVGTWVVVVVVED